MDSNSNSNGESVMILNEKDSRDDEKPEEAAALVLPEQKHEEGSNSRKRKKKRRKTESNVHPPQVCPTQPLAVATAISEESKPTEPTFVVAPPIPHPSQKIVFNPQGHKVNGESPQLCLVQHCELNKIKEENREEPSVVIAQHSGAYPKDIEPVSGGPTTVINKNKRKRKKKKARVGETVENPVDHLHFQNAVNHAQCQTLADPPSPVCPKPQGNAENPQLCLLVEHPELNKIKEEKGDEPNVAIAQNLEVCPKPLLDMAVADELEEKNEAEPNKAPAEQSQAPPCSESVSGGTTTKITKSKRKRKNKKARLDEMVENPVDLLHLQNALNYAQSQPQADPPIPISPKPQGNAENPQFCLLVEHPELNKIKEEKGDEPNVAIAQNLEVCPKPLLDMAVADELEEKNEAEPSKTPAEQSQAQPCSESVSGGTTTKITKSKRKRKNKKARLDEMVENPVDLPHLQNALNHAQSQPQADPPIPISPKPQGNAENPQLCLLVEHPELNKIKEEKGDEPNVAIAQNLEVCPKPLLDMAVAAELEEKNEAEPSKALAEQSQAQPCSESVSGGTTTKNTKSKRKRKNKKARLDEMVENPVDLLHLQNALNHAQSQTQADPPIPISLKPQGNAENPQPCLVEHPELNLKMEEKGDGPNVAIAQTLEVCPKPLLEMGVATELEERNMAEPIAAPAEQSQQQPCSEPVSGGPTTMTIKSKRKRMHKKTRLGKLVENPMDLLNFQNAPNHAQNQTLADPPIPISFKLVSLVDQAKSVGPAVSMCPEPAPQIGQNIPVDSAIPIATDLEKKNEAEPCKAPAEQSQPQPCSEPVSGGPIIMITKSRRKRMNKTERMGEVVENPKNLLHLQNGLNHAQIQTQADPPVPICPKPVSLIDQASSVDLALSIFPGPATTMGLTVPADSAISVDMEQKMSKNQRRKMKRKLQDGEQVQPNEHNTELPGTAVQSSICQTATSTGTAVQTPICHAPAAPIGPIMDPCLAIPICPKSVSPIDQPHLVDPALSICPEPAPPIGQTTPADSAMPFDTEQRMSKSQRRKMKRKLLDEAQPNEHNNEQPGSAVQTSICHTATPSFGPIMEPHPAILVCSKPVSSIDQTSPADPTLSICPEPAPPVSKSIPLESVIPIDTEQKLSKGQRQRMNRKLRNGVQPNEHNFKQPETPVQTSICDTATPPTGPIMEPHPAIPVWPKPVALIDQTSPAHPALSICPVSAPLASKTIPVEPTIPKDTEQKLSKGQRKRLNRRLRDGAQPNEQNSKQPETQVQALIRHTLTPPRIYPRIPMSPHCAIPITQAIPAYPDNNTNALTGWLFQALIRHTLTPPIYPRVPRSPHCAIPITRAIPAGPDNNTNAHTGWLSRSSKICWACQQADHEIKHCRLLKCLRKHDEVCFFCGQIGHSLGKCSVSLAGGGRFAKCLLCHAQGHFSYDCPGDGHGNYAKVLTADWDINRTAKA